MLRWLRPSSAGIIGLATLVVVGIVVAVKGETIFSPGALNGERRGPRLGGVASHAEIGNQCSACHAAPWSTQNMAGRCLQCHTDVSTQLDAKAAMHGLLANGRQCRSCHSEHQGEHASLTDMSKFDHDFASFPLTGKHRATECQACHVNNLFKGTAQSCIGCHAEPTVHKGQFGTECASCHSTNTWKDSAISRAKLGTFDHDRTGFKLTGKHTAVECQACHVNKVFKGTSQSCVSCHAEPPVPKVHSVRFGTNCASCHTTDSWAGSAFKHTAFSISHGKRNNTCATCHNDVEHFEQYTCYNCHEHEKSRMERIHARRKVANLDACIECHGKRRRADAGGDDLGVGCPVASLASTREHDWSKSIPSGAALWFDLVSLDKVEKPYENDRPSVLTPAVLRFEEFFLSGERESRLINPSLLGRREDRNVAGAVIRPAHGTTSSRE